MDSKNKVVIKDEPSQQRTIIVDNDGYFYKVVEVEWNCDCLKIKIEKQ